MRALRESSMAKTRFDRWSLGQITHSLFFAGQLRLKGKYRRRVGVAFSFSGVSNPGPALRWGRVVRLFWPEDSQI